MKKGKVLQCFASIARTSYAFVNIFVNNQVVHVRLFIVILIQIGKGGNKRKRGKNFGYGDKRELLIKEEGQEYGQILRMLG